MLCWFFKLSPIAKTYCFLSSLCLWFGCRLSFVCYSSICHCNNELKWFWQVISRLIYIVFVAWKAFYKQNHGKEDAALPNVLFYSGSVSLWAALGLSGCVKGGAVVAKNKPRGASECVCAHTRTCAFFKSPNSHPASVSGCVWPGPAQPNKLRGVWMLNAGAALRVSPGNPATPSKLRNSTLQSLHSAWLPCSEKHPPSHTHPGASAAASAEHH